MVFVQAAGRLLDWTWRVALGVLVILVVVLAWLVAAGHRNKEIARQLTVTEGTVKVHLHSVYSKLGVDGRLQLSKYVRERGLALACSLGPALAASPHRARLLVRMGRVQLPRRSPPSLRAAPGSLYLSV